MWEWVNWTNGSYDAEISGNLIFSNALKLVDQQNNVSVTALYVINTIRYFHSIRWCGTNYIYGPAARRNFGNRNKIIKANYKFSVLSSGEKNERETCGGMQLI